MNTIKLKIGDLVKYIDPHSIDVAGVESFIGIITEKMNRHGRYKVLIEGREFDVLFSRLELIQ